MLAVAAWTAAPVLAQPYAARSVEIAGETLRYEIRTLPAGAFPVAAPAPLEPTSALNTATLLNRYLSAGRIEDAALLSNAPRRRFEVLRDYRRSVGEDGFRKVYAEYLAPENRLVAELIMDRHSLLIWRLGRSGTYAGQYFVRIEGKVLMDDVPGTTRARLHRVFEAVRAGEVALPP